MTRRRRPPDGPTRRAPGRRREDRRADGAEVVYGRNAVREALAGPRTVGPIWATGRARELPWLEGRAGEVRSAQADEIEQRCGSAEHQGVCAQVSPFAYAAFEGLLEAPDPLIVVLDQVTDPQNLGAVCRAAESAGATGVVIPDRRAAAVTAAVCRASAGAVEHLPVARVRNIADVLADARVAGCWVYGAAAGAAMAYDEPDYRGGVVLVLGAEGRGLRPRVAAGCDALVALPQRGRIASLNVGAAAAVLLYEIVQRRGTA